jgi:hypothetical protein
MKKNFINASKRRLYLELDYDGPLSSFKLEHEVTQVLKAIEGIEPLAIFVAGNNGEPIPIGSAVAPAQLLVSVEDVIQGRKNRDSRVKKV